MGNLKKAIENFQEALKINPEDVNANKYLKATKEKETTLKSSQVGFHFFFLKKSLRNLNLNLNLK